MEIGIPGVTAPNPHRYISVTIPLPTKWYHKWFGLNPGSVSTLVEIKADSYETAPYEKVYLFGKTPFNIYVAPKEKE